MARRGWAAHSARREPLQVAVCGGDLGQAGPRLVQLCSLHAERSRVELLGWQPGVGPAALPEALRNPAWSCHAVFGDADGFALRALQLVAAHPADLLHLVQPTAAGVLIALLHKLLWGTRVVVDVEGGLPPPSPPPARLPPIVAITGAGMGRRRCSPCAAARCLDGRYGRWQGPHGWGHRAGRQVAGQGLPGALKTAGTRGAAVAGGAASAASVEADPFPAGADGGRRTASGHRRTATGGARGRRGSARIGPATRAAACAAPSPAAAHRGRRRRLSGSARLPARRAGCRPGDRIGLTLGAFGRLQPVPGQAAIELLGRTVALRDAAAKADAPTAILHSLLDLHGLADGGAGDTRPCRWTLDAAGLQLVDLWFTSDTALRLRLQASGGSRLPASACGSSAPSRSSRARQRCARSANVLSTGPVRTSSTCRCCSPGTPCCSSRPRPKVSGWTAWSCPSPPCAAAVLTMARSRRVVPWARPWPTWPP